MASRSKPTDPAPPIRSLAGLAEAAQDCEACPLYRNATQAVFGEGPARAAMVLVGEQPGDAEDKAGHPFVGPAGGVLDKALEQADVNRTDVYVTNAVKHFKWEPRGKWRIHMKPRVSEIKACKPWLEAELARVRPAVIVCMGTTAAHSLIGPKITIAGAKGQVYETAFGPVVVTRHPSSVLRTKEREERQALLQDLTNDLKFAAEVIKRRK
jgi:DNA polymerase